MTTTNELLCAASILLTPLSSYMEPLPEPEMRSEPQSEDTTSRHEVENVEPELEPEDEDITSEPYEERCIKYIAEYCPIWPDFIRECASSRERDMDLYAIIVHLDDFFRAGHALLGSVTFLMVQEKMMQCGMFDVRLLWTMCLFRIMLPMVIHLRMI